MSEDERVTQSTGNVFADLGVDEPDTVLLKAELARKISRIITGRHLTQEEAAKILGVDQPKISALTRGRLYGFSTERLMGFLTALGRDVEVTVKKRGLASEPGRVRVSD